MTLLTKFLTNNNNNPRKRIEKWHRLGPPSGWATTHKAGSLRVGRAGRLDSKPKELDVDRSVEDGYQGPCPTILIKLVRNP